MGERGPGPGPPGPRVEPGPRGPTRGAVGGGWGAPAAHGAGAGAGCPLGPRSAPGTAGPGPSGWGGAALVPGAGRGTRIHPPSPLPCVGEDGDADPLGFCLGEHTLRAPPGPHLGEAGGDTPPCTFSGVRCPWVLPPGTAPHPQIPHQLWGSCPMLTPR